MTEIFTKPEWIAENRRFECRQNGLGSWWPVMLARAPGGSWYQISIRDSNPFKTLDGAIRFTEKTIQRINDRDNKRTNP